MTRRGCVRLILGQSAAIATVLAAMAVAPAAQAAISDKPDTPYKLATFEVAGKTHVGLVLGTRVLAIDGANPYLVQKAKVPRVAIPNEMRAIIEQYATVSPRLYQIANYFKTNPTAGLPFAFDADKVSYKAPIKYPWNILAIAANYKAHAEGMGGGRSTPPTAPAAGRGQQGGQAGRGDQGGGRAGGGFDATAAERIVPDRDAPVFFAKPYYIVDGRQRTDYEGEMAIVMGPTPAFRVPRERAHDYVFGYSIMQDISDRGSERLREVSMFAGTNWFEGKSTDRGAPFGPVIVPKEFLPKAADLHITTKVNGEILQDARTSEFIWDEAHMIGFLTSRLTLYPGDVISSGTPAGTGAERGKFLKPGDVVTIEIEGIGTLTTPFKALSEKPGTK